MLKFPAFSNKERGIALEKLRERLSTWVEVSNGEIRIKYFGTEDLDRLTEIIDGPREDLDSLLFGRRTPEQDAQL